MSQLLQHLQELVGRQIAERGIVVWYDPEGAYRQVVDRLALDGVTLLRGEDGFFRLREKLEPWLEWVDEQGRPLAEKETPPRLLLYVPVRPEQTDHALVEVESAGVVLAPGAAVVERNTRLATLVEQVYQRVAPERAGQVSRQVEEGLLSFADVERLLEEAGAASSGALKLIFGQGAPLEVLLRFLSSESHDGELQKKKAMAELVGLAVAEVGWPADRKSTSPAAFRGGLARHVLLGELALALPEAQRGTVAGLAQLPGKPAQRDFIRQLGQTWRNRLDLQEAYAGAAGEVEQAAGLSKLGLTGPELDGLETFSCLDQAALGRAGTALLEGREAEAAALAGLRRNSFWTRRRPERLLQWAWVETVASLLREAGAVRTAVRSRVWTLGELVAAYARHARPWLKVDTLARQLESRYARFDLAGDAGGPDWEKIMARARHSYLEAVEVMTLAYTQALEQAGFREPATLAQRRVYTDHVQPRLSAGKKTAFVLVDALRYEMAADLVDGLGSEFRATLEPALGQLPSITPVGMAAVLPGAEGELAVEDVGGKMHVRVGQARVTDRAARLEELSRQVGSGVGVAKLGDVARLTPKRRKELGEARLLVVTSQEIDRLGEGGGDDDQARLYMDEVLEKIRRGFRNLAAMGFADIVVVADHGFLFAEGFEQGLSMDPPGGETVELHARCWLGRGGEVGPGYFRVNGAALGLAGGLEFAFPRGLGTFKIRGGAGAYFHGGASLQEQVVPVLVLAHQGVRAPVGGGVSWSLEMARKTITNRLFSVTVCLRGEEMFAPEPRAVRVELRSGKDLVARTVVASYGFDESTLAITLEAGKPNAVTLMLEPGPHPQQAEVRVLDASDETPLAVLGGITLNLAI